MLEQVNSVLPIVTFLLTLIIGYWAIKRIKKEAISLINGIIIQQKATLKIELEAWLNSETGAKAIYSIGALAGSALMSGTGLQKKSGKFKWQDLLGEVAGEFLKKRIGLGGERQTLNPQRSDNALKSA